MRFYHLTYLTGTIPHFYFEMMSNVIQTRQTSTIFPGSAEPAYLQRKIETTDIPSALSRGERLRWRMGADAWVDVYPE